MKIEWKRTPTPLASVPYVAESSVGHVIHTGTKSGADLVVAYLNDRETTIDDLKAEVESCRKTIGALTVRLASASEVLGKAAESGKVSAEDVTRIVTLCAAEMGMKP